MTISFRAVPPLGLTQRVAAVIAHRDSAFEKGDLVVMPDPDGEDDPPVGWTRHNGCLWRLIDGTEGQLPLSATKVAETSGVAAIL